MDSLVVEIINMILSSLNNRQYLLELKKTLNGFISDDKNIDKSKKFLNNIINKDIESNREALAELDDLFDTEIINKINLNGIKYTAKYRQDFIKNLNIEKFLVIVGEYLDKIDENVNKLKTSRGEKLRSRLMDTIYGFSKEMQDQLTNFKASDGATQSFIIDVNNPSLTLKTLTPVIENSIAAKNTVVSSFPGFDTVVNGGLVLGTTTLIVAKPAGFKSGLLQNICIYATINNDPGKFSVPPGKIPAVFFVSLENYERQLYNRHVSFYHNSKEEAERMTKNMTNEEIAQYIMKLSIENHTKMPIIYIDRVGKETSISDVAAAISEYEQVGYHPVLLGIDYLSKMTTDDPDYRRYSDTAGEGAKKQAKKSEEIRAYCKMRNIAAVIPEQLSTDAIKEIESLRPECKRLDPLKGNCTLDMINGARDLSREYENVIFIYRSDIVRQEQNGDTLIKDSYISLVNKKTREEGKDYMLSPRDKITAPLVDLNLRKLKSGPLKEKIKDTGDLHTVSPLHNFRISNDDYAKTILAYYINENSDAMSLHSLMEENNKILSDTSEAFQEVTERERIVRSLNL